MGVRDGGCAQLVALKVGGWAEFNKREQQGKEESSWGTSGEPGRASDGLDQAALDSSLTPFKPCLERNQAFIAKLPSITLGP